MELSKLTNLTLQLDSWGYHYRTAQRCKVCTVSASSAHSSVHFCQSSLLILHFVVIFLTVTLLSSDRPCMVEELTQLNHTVAPRTSPTLCPQKQQRYRRANLLSTKRNLAALTKEDQGSKRQVSGLGVWRASVAIALPSCCFFPLSPSHAAGEKTKERDM